MAQYFIDYERVQHHRSMLSDTIRTNAFRKAIKKIVSEGDIVVDLGTGVGILAFFAAPIAKKVYAIERTDIINIAKKLAKENNFENIIFINGDSEKTKLPEKCDIIISECIGYFALQENMLSDIVDFRKKYLKGNGKIIPGKIDLFVSPVSSKAAYEEVDFWSKKYGMNFFHVRKIAENTSYHKKIQPKELLAEPVLLKKINMEKDNEISLNKEVILSINKSGKMNGFCGYFSAELGNNIVLTNAPGEKTHWKSQFFPIKPINVKKGDQIKIKIKAELHKALIDWKWEVKTKNYKSKHSTKKGIRLKEL